MLQKFREQIKGWIATVVIGLLVVPFALWGVSSYTQYSQGDWVAMVDGEPITVGEFRNEYQQQLARLQQAFGDQYRPEYFENQRTREQVVDQMVRTALIELRTRDGGYRISDAQLAAEIQGLEFFQAGGKFSRDVMAERLRSINMSPAQFDARLRRDMLMAQLPSAVTASEFVTADELARQVRLRDEQRAATWLAVPAAMYLPQIELAETELEAFYAANQARYMTEETVALEYLELTPSALPAAGAPTDDQLQELYAREQDRYVRQEQRSARHILLDATDQAKAEALAKELMAKINAGEDFATIARQASVDPGSAAQGGDLGWVERGIMTGAFEDALFSMQAGEVRGPVKTEFGIHIIKLEQIRPTEARAFADVREELVARWALEQGAERFAKASEQLADLAYANPDSLVEAATALSLKIGRVDGVTRTGGAGVAVEPKVREAAFSIDVLGERRNSAPIELEAERLLVVRVADHAPATLRPFTEVRALVLDAAREERAGAMAQALAEQLAQRLREGAIPEALAKAERLPPPITRSLKRDGQGAPAEVTRALFATGRPVAGQVLAGVASLPNGDRLVFRVEAVVPGDASTLAEPDRVARRDEIARRNATIALTAYTAALQRKSEVAFQKDKAQ